MNSEVEAEAVRLAEECAQTLLAYYRAEVPNGAAFNAWMINCDEAWRDHESALRTFADTFPQVVDWRELVPQAALEQIAGARP